MQCLPKKHKKRLLTNRSRFWVKIKSAPRWTAKRVVKINCACIVIARTEQNGGKHSEDREITATNTENDRNSHLRAQIKAVANYTLHGWPVPTPACENTQWFRSSAKIVKPHRRARNANNTAFRHIESCKTILNRNFIKKPACSEVLALFLSSSLLSEIFENWI